MDTDVLFVLGVGVAVLMIPAMLSAIIDGRTPHTPAFLLIVVGLMIGYAVIQKPSTYSFSTIPDTLVRVIARYTN